MKECALSKDEAVLVIIDIQERLASVMNERGKVIGNCLHLIESAKLLHVPVVLTEQYPKGLGPTVSEIKTVLPACEPVEKTTFSCCGAPAFLDRCVLQSCVDLIRGGFMVHAVSDAQCSRAKENHKIGLEFMRDAGAVITCTETALFQLLEKAGTEEFKTISKRIR
jgi:isochorismate hydrolase